MEAVILTIATFFSTLFGGLFAVKYKNYLHLIMGFTAGVLLGVVAFDIFPGNHHAGQRRGDLSPLNRWWR